MNAGVLKKKHSLYVYHYYVTFCGARPYSEEEAREKMILSLSYNSEFSGFAARLTKSQAKKIGRKGQISDTIKNTVSGLLDE